ncbi:MAG: hypothetical protein GC206_05415 [Alphaproteobacteria bacterium]|nr:hypothetical protein [Alphaproteobacteria bacterium]
MTVSVIVHIEADRAYVDSLQDSLESVRLVACVLRPKAPLMAFDARLPLMLVWSRAAEERRAGPAFAAMARLHRGQTIVCVIDDCPAPASLQKAGVAVVNGSPRSSMFPHGLNAALREAERRAARAPAPPAASFTPEAASRRAFAEGMTRGLAGSVALLGVGGAAALAVEQFGGASMDSPTPRVEIARDMAPAGDAAAQAGVESFAMDGPVYAEAEMILVEAQAPEARADLRDVPLAQPSPELTAARRTLGFADRPLEVWAPDEAMLEGLSSLGDLDALQDSGWRPIERVIIDTETLEAKVAPIERSIADSDPAI